MVRFNTFAQNAARLLDKYPMRTATSDAIEYITSAAASVSKSMSTFEQNESIVQNAEELVENNPENGLKLNPSLHEQLQSHLDEEQQRREEYFRINAEHLKKDKPIDYTYVLESAPTIPPVEETKSSAKDSNLKHEEQASKDRIEELRVDRDKFFKVGGHLMTSLFADNDLSREFKNNYNAFTQEIIKEQAKAKASNEESGHFESLVANNTNDDTKKAR